MILASVLLDHLALQEQLYVGQDKHNDRYWPCLWMYIMRVVFAVVWMGLRNECCLCSDQNMPNMHSLNRSLSGAWYCCECLEQQWSAIKHYDQEKRKQPTACWPPKPEYFQFLFSHVHCICHVRCCQNFCIPCQNHLCQPLNIWEKKYMGLGKCTGWPPLTLIHGHGCDID